MRSPKRGNCGLWSLALLGLGIPALVHSTTDSKPYHKHSTNTTGAVFEPRGDVGGGGYSSASVSSFGASEGKGGGSYGAPSVGHDSYSAEGGHKGGGYGMPQPTAYKYQIYPAAMSSGGGWGMMSGGGGGWGAGDEDDDDGGGFDKELVNLLGLKGLKKVKGLKGILGVGKGLLLLKKLGLIPLLPVLLPVLLPILLPLLLPLIFIILASLLLPLLLLLFIPILVISPARTARTFSTTAKNANYVIKDTLDELMSRFPEDVTQIIDKIRGKSVASDASKVSSSVSSHSVNVSSQSSGSSAVSAKNYQTKAIKFVKPQVNQGPNLSFKLKSVPLM